MCWVIFLQKLSASRHEIFFLHLESDGVRYEKRALPGNVRAVNWQGGLGRPDTLEARLALIPAFEAVLESVKPDLVHAGPVQSCGLMTALTGFRPFGKLLAAYDYLEAQFRLPA